VVEARVPDLNSRGHSRALPERGRQPMPVLEQSPVAGQASSLTLALDYDDIQDSTLTLVATADMPSLDVEAIIATLGEVRTTVTAAASVVWGAPLHVPRANIVKLDISLSNHAYGGTEEKKDLRAHRGCLSCVLEYEWSGMSQCVSADRQQ
jgi:hypothetical protein